MESSNKEFYTDYADHINSKRLGSPHALRRYAHEQQYKSFLDRVSSGQQVLDAGCGEGALSIMLAKKGAIVTGTDISIPNIQASLDKVITQFEKLK